MLIVSFVKSYLRKVLVQKVRQENTAECIQHYNRKKVLILCLEKVRQVIFQILFHNLSVLSKLQWFICILPVNFIEKDQPANRSRVDDHDCMRN